MAEEPSLAHFAPGHPARRHYRQAIPRPTSARPGGRSPWADMPSFARSGLTIPRVRAALDGALVPVGANYERPAAAAVLVALYEEEGEATVLMIRRGLALASGPGDLAFPGGRVEAGESPFEAAIRESEEEVGLRREEVEVLGRLALLERARTPGTIAPFVGLLPARPELRVNAFEVDAVIPVPLASLLDDGTYWEESWSAQDGPTFVLPFFSGTRELGDDMIWGASARILTDLLVLLTR